jgi:hypothetical protein
VRNLETGRPGRPRHASVRLLADALGLTGQARADLERAYDAAGGGAARQPGAGQVRPAQLPAGVAAFTGRAGPLADLDAVLSPGGGEPAVAVCTVSGTAGVGKTALAIPCWGHI